MEKQDAIIWSKGINKNRVCVGIVWMGKLPSYYPAWKKSVFNNNDIDFMLVTDQKECISEKNLICKHMTLSDIKDKIQSLLNREVELSSAYKLCDYKPLYGAIFQDDLEGYEYWGHCDMDAIFGNMMKYLSDKLGGGFDRIFYSGHLCLYKNTDEMRWLFAKSREDTNSAISINYVCSTPFPCYFDEHLGMDRLSKTVNWYNAFYEEYVIDIFPDELEFRTFTNKEPFVVEWNNGSIYKVNTKDGTKKEYMYTHFQKRGIVIDSVEDSPVYLVPNRLSVSAEYRLHKIDKWVYKMKLLINRAKRIYTRTKQYGVKEYYQHHKYLNRL